MSDPEAPAGRVTLSTVAEVAGVSRAAASLALRGKPGVGAETRQRVLQVANEIGYRARPSTGAAATGTVGLLVKSRPTDVGVVNAFYGPVIAGISQACTELHIDLRLDSLAVNERFDPIEVPRMIQSADIDGLIILGTYLSEATASVIGAKPAVLVDGYSVDPARFPAIVCDNRGGTAAATRHLIGLGHRRIALVGTTPTSFPSILERRAGYEAAMRAAGLDPVYVDAPHDDQLACVTAVRQALAADPTITAIAAANDVIAVTVLGELQDRIPHEISVTGFDDIDAAHMVRPRLDTVSVDKQAMGRLAVSVLRHRIANPEDPVFALVQQTRLVVRESSAPPR